MSMSDPLGDMLTRIRNAQRAKKSDVVSPASRLRESVLEVLKREGYIRDFRYYKFQNKFNLKVGDHVVLTGGSVGASASETNLIKLETIK